VQCNERTDTAIGREKRKTGDAVTDRASHMLTARVILAYVTCSLFSRGSRMMQK